ncbi:MAG: Hpt domain-containing protein [Lachnospiraceae bacterium]|nr:Hpt domain-containing protein [Lachnospiraceae bacterium]
MITLEALREFGADTEKGLAMCMGNEALYLRLVSTVPAEPRFADLARALDEKNYDAAFDAAHALKGVLGNLSLMPLFETASKITEHLRGRSDMDYSALMSELLAEKEKLEKLCM